MSEQQLLRMKDLVTKTAMSQSKLYDLIAKGSFPKPKRLSHKVAVWPREVVDKWMEEALAN